MWPNAFPNGNAGNDQQEHQVSPNDMGPSPFMNGSMLPMPPLMLPLNFPQTTMPLMGNGGSGFRTADVGSSNNDPFLHNQQIPGLRTPVFSPRLGTDKASSTVTPTPRATTQINARAAELKAQLLKGRSQRATSAAPVVATSRPSDPVALIVSESLTSSHSSPSRSQLVGQGTYETELDDLISQYAPSDRPNRAVVGQTEARSNSVLAASTEKPIKESKAQVKSLTPPPNGVAGVKVQIGNGDQRPRSRSDEGSISEGEIIEDVPPKPPKTMPPPLGPRQQNANKTQAFAIDGGRRESIRPLQREQPRKISPAPPPVAETTSKVQTSSVQQPSSFTAGVTDPKLDKAFVSSLDLRYTDRDKRPAQETISESHHRPLDTVVQGRNEPPRLHIQNKSKLPTLSEFLAQNDDLRDWLELTKYHKKDFRDGILDTHRKIAALDAQKAQLLATMRLSGVVPIMDSPITGTPTLSATESILEMPHAYSITNKRTYDDLRDSRDNNPSKVARMDERSFDPKLVRSQDDSDHDRLANAGHRGYDSYQPGGDRDFRERPEPWLRGRRRSHSPLPYLDHRFGSPPPTLRYPDMRRGSLDDGYDRGMMPAGRGGYKGSSADGRGGFGSRGRGRGRGNHGGSLESRTEHALATHSNSKVWKDGKGRGGPP